MLTSPSKKHFAIMFTMILDSLENIRLGNEMSPWMTKYFGAKLFQVPAASKFKA